MICGDARHVYCLHGPVVTGNAVVLILPVLCVTSCEAIPIQAPVLPKQHRHRFMTMHALQVSTKLLDHLVARSTKAYKQGIQDSPTKKVILTNCHQVAGAGPPMAFVEHCLRRCPHLEVVEATGFGGVKGAFHLNDLLMLLRTLNKMRPAPEVQTSAAITSV